LWPIPFHDFDFASGKIIFQAFSLRDKMQTRISPINTNSICKTFVQSVSKIPQRLHLECGGLTPLSHTATCRAVPKRGLVRALQIETQRCFQFVPPSLRVKIFA
jgi:hypothetical protein